MDGWMDRRCLLKKSNTECKYLKICFTSRPDCPTFYLTLSIFIFLQLDIVCRYILFTFLPQVLLEQDPDIRWWMWRQCWYPLCTVHLPPVPPPPPLWVIFRIRTWCECLLESICMYRFCARRVHFLASNLPGVSHMFHDQFMFFFFMTGCCLCFH